MKILGVVSAEGQRRYSPAECIGCERKAVMGNPDPEHVSTSYIERANLSLRMGMRRFTRLTNGFSKKIENHAASVALFLMYYNFARVHTTLRCSPAMAAERGFSLLGDQGHRGHDRRLLSPTILWGGCGLRVFQRNDHPV